MIGFEILWTIISIIVLILLVLIFRTRIVAFTGNRGDYRVEYVICAAHGIRTDGKRIKDLFTYLRKKYPDYAKIEKTKLIPLRYGYILASVCFMMKKFAPVCWGWVFVSRKFENFIVLSF